VISILAKDEGSVSEAMTAELPVTGYLGRFSARPGGRLSVHVSLRDGGTYRARLVRVLGGDPNPDGPGMRFEDLSHRFDRTIPGRRQEIRAGSYGLVPAGPRRAAGDACTWTVLAWMARPGEACAVLAEEADGWRVVISAGRAGAAARLEWPGGAVELATGAHVRRRTWYRLWLTADPGTGEIRLAQAALDLPCDRAVASASAPGLRTPAAGVVMFAAEAHENPCRHFTGRLEAPAILRGAVRDWPDPARLPEGAAVLAAWDFADDIGGTRLTDTGPSACHGHVVNLPTRAVVGAHWSGRETCWRHAPADYAAIHFHDDDIDDCRWAPDFDLEIPGDLPSGAYALHLSCAAGEDRLPFYVLPARDGPRAPIAFLASTFTYQAYANHARGNFDAAFRARVRAWNASPYNPDDYPVYGRSTYNRHGDNSGIAYSSRLRPILTMRPGFLTFNDPRGSGLRHYPADTHLLGWLEAKGFGFDIVTDEDLHEEGPALLAPYRTVLTGSHPEYHTPETLDALEHYTGHGGRLVYLGGNGFYWRIARHPDMPGVIEIRRAEGGIRAWEAEPGEYHNAFDGQLGGLWRRNRRPPQRLAGVGFSGQGLFEGTHYRRLPASRDPRYAWIFEGIGEDTIGGYGLSGGGAAGFELDRADFDLGTPEDAAILARSEDPPTSFVTVPEELLTHIATISGETPDELKRGEIVYFDTPSGGAVFSVGSITFCGSLWRNGFEGPVSRLLENVVRRFAS
jgi:N,N-dimethylformamidase